MYFYCIKNFITSQKNQPLLFVLGGWLKEKNRPS